MCRALGEEIKKMKPKKKYSRVCKHCQHFTEYDNNLGRCAYNTKYNLTRRATHRPTLTSHDMTCKQFAIMMPEFIKTLSKKLDKLDDKI